MNKKQFLKRFTTINKKDTTTKLPRKKKKQLKKLLLEYLTLIELDKLFNNVEYILNKN